MVMDILPSVAALLGVVGSVVLGKNISGRSWEDVFINCLVTPMKVSLLLFAGGMSLVWTILIDLCKSAGGLVIADGIVAVPYVLVGCYLLLSWLNMVLQAMPLDFLHNNETSSQVAPPEQDRPQQPRRSNRPQKRAAGLTGREPMLSTKPRQ